MQCPDCGTKLTKEKTYSILFKNESIPFLVCMECGLITEFSYEEGGGWKLE